MRAAIYARYSSDNQRDASIEDQVRLCREYADREGWTFTQTYADRAISGSTMLRPGLQALIGDAMAGRFDIILAEALDRISRDQADVASIYKRLRFAGIPLVTLAEGEITDLHVGLKGTMNALFLKDLADKTRRGLRGRVEAGRSGGGNCYGYNVIHQPTARGEPERGLRAITPGEAYIVRRIFEEFAAGRSPRKIAFGLNAESIPGPSGVAWGQSTINGSAARGTGILNNELYIGRLVWNRLRYVKDPDSGKRVSRPNPPSAWIVQTVPELAIISDELWRAVKDRQKQVKRDTRPDHLADKPFWARTRPRYLLSGLMKCGCCGGAYTKISTNLFGCATARNKGTCGNRLNIHTDQVEAIVLDGLRHHLMDADLFKLFVQEFTAEWNRLSASRGADKVALTTEFRRIEQQIDKLVTAIAEGTPAKPLHARINSLEQRRQKLEDIAACAEDVMPALHPNLAELYRGKVAALGEALWEPSSRDQAFEAIRSLIDEVRFVPVDGVLKVELKGELAGILALCAEGKEKAGSLSGTGFVEQIKLVAGRGFEPLTFRL